MLSVNMGKAIDEHGVTTDIDEHGVTTGIESQRVSSHNGHRVTTGVESQQAPSLTWSHRVLARTLVTAQTADI